MAVLPGTLPLSVIRGIAFNSVILQCKDDNVLVSGTLSPDVTGTYVWTGRFNDHDLYVLSGAPATFLYFHPIATSYIIAATLTTGVIADYWFPSSPLTEPTGTYGPAGAYTGNATATDNPVDLTGYIPKAEVRRTSDSPEVTLDLNPSLTDGPNGEVTIPEISSDDTQDFDFLGTFNWDLVLINGDNERLGPFVRGVFVVADNITHIPPT